MEYLVNIRLSIPPSMDEQAYKELVITERARAASLAEAGKLIRMWRVPGRRENWGLWQAESASELHDILASLPAWPWMDLDVHPLAEHPVDPAREGGDWGGHGS